MHINKAIKNTANLEKKPPILLRGRTAKVLQLEHDMMLPEAVWWGLGLRWAGGAAGRESNSQHGARCTVGRTTRITAEQDSVARTM